MLFLILVGIVSLIFGILLLFSPQVLHGLNDKASKVMNQIFITIDKKIYDLRIGIGVSSILISAFAFFIIYFLVRKYG